MTRSHRRFGWSFTPAVAAFSVIGATLVGAAPLAAPVAAAAPSAAVPSGAGVESVGPIAVIAGSGPVSPVLPPAVVQGGVALSARPVLPLPAEAASATQVEVVDVSLGRAAWAWVGQVRSGRVQIAKDVLSGHAYAWSWRESDAAPWRSGGTFIAKYGTETEQGTVAIGSAVVSPLTGEIGTGWSSATVAGPAMRVSAGLTWRSGAVGRDAVVPGLPDGWRLNLSSGSSWATLTESRDRVVRGVAPSAPRAALSGSTVRVMWRYPVGAARAFDVEIQRPGRPWRVAQTVNAASSEVYDVSVPASGAGAGARVRVVARVGRTQASTRFLVTSGVEVASPAGVIATRLTRAALAPAAPVGGAGSGSYALSGEAPRAVTVSAWDGSGLTFVRNASGVYEQVLTSSSDVAGARNALDRRLVDGQWVWELTDATGATTTFFDGHVVSVAGSGLPLSTITWDGDRVASIRPSGVAVDSARVMNFIYEGSGSCPSNDWTDYGYASVPDGMLCRITYGAGVATDIAYVSGVAGASQIAMIKDIGDSSMTLGWDSVGHLVATRPDLVSRSAMVDASVKGLLSQIEYDDRGRAVTLREAGSSSIDPRMVTQIVFPQISEAAVIAGDAVTARVNSSVGSASWSKTIEYDAARHTIVGGVDRAGMRTTVVTDRFGRIQKVVDPEKRITTYSYDSIGVQTGQSGPFAGDASRGLVSGATYDADVVDGRATAWTGMNVRTFSRADFSGESQGAWWGKDDRSGLGYSWDQGPDVEWSARATAKWTPAKDARDWNFRIDARGAQVSLIVDGELCVAVNGRCEIDDLGPGPKSVIVQVNRAGASGGFRILAAPVGQEPQAIPGPQVEPMFGVTTSESVNDVYPGSPRTSETVTKFAAPWDQTITSVTLPGGLTTRRSVEDIDPDNGLWGRPLSRTTPGGRTVTFGYYGDDETAAVPDICDSNAAPVPQYGALHTVTRQDGTVDESVFDVRGQLVASITHGVRGAKEVTCLKYDDGGILVSRRTFNTQGALVETTVIDPAVDGKPWISSSTTTHGPGAPVGVGETYTTRTYLDMSGRVVRFVDGFGTTTTTTYTDEGRPATMSITAPAGVSGPGQTLRFAYTYTRQQGWLRSVSVNGVTAATMAYDETLGRIASVTYPDGISIAYDYFGNGQANRSTLTYPGGRLVSALDLKGTGRVMGSTLTGTGANAYTESRGYGYDLAGRLASATITSTQSGMPASTSYTYSYGAQADRCGVGYPGSGKDSLRSGGTRNGVSYTTCHDVDGQTTSTTDPLVTGGSGTASLTHDRLGRVTRIDGPSRDVTLTWSAGTQLASIVDGDTTTTLDTFSGMLRDKTVQSTSTSRIGFGYADAGAPTLMYGMTGDAPTSVASRMFGLPGGVQVAMPTGQQAVLTFSDLEGAASMTLAAPSLGAGASSDLAPEVGPSARFGPFGEALVAPDFTTAVPHFGWQNDAGMETYAGQSSITQMGARPYLPALGEFLAKDPIVTSGNNLYSFTSGDVVNGADFSGGSETCGFLCYGLAGGGAIAALFGPIGALVGTGMAAAAVALSVRAAKANDTVGMDNAELVVSSAALIFSGAKLLFTTVGSGLIYKFIKNKANRAVKGRGGAALTEAAEDAGQGLLKSERASTRGTQEIKDILAGKGNFGDDLMGSSVQKSYVEVTNTEIIKSPVKSRNQILSNEYQASSPTVTEKSMSVKLNNKYNFEEFAEKSQAGSIGTDSGNHINDYITQQILKNQRASGMGGGFEW